MFLFRESDGIPYGMSQKTGANLNKTAIKQRISAEREKMGWTQVQLAEKAGITPAAVCQIEKGDRVPTIPVLYRIAQVLRVSLDYLTGQKDSIELKDALQNQELKTFFRKYQNLDEEDRRFIEKYVKAMSKSGK